MNRERMVSVTAVVLVVAVTAGVLWILSHPATNTGDSSVMNDDHDDLAEHADDEFERGPHGGRLLRDGAFEVEVVIVESGLPPEFRLYARETEAPVEPSAVAASIELARLGGRVDRFDFEPEGEYLRGIGRVDEPHSFDVTLAASYAGRSFEWSYESHEGRTEIPQRVAEAQGLAVEAAGPAVIVETIALTGTVQADPGRISEVRPRFPGVVTSVTRTVGDVVARGETLATVETNESLRAVAVEAPIGGLIVDRQVQAGQATGQDPLFVITDLSEVWIYLDVFGDDIDTVAAGQAVRIETLSGTVLDETIDWISPLVAHGSQSVRARVTVPNPDGRLRPGQFVRASVEIARHAVPLAVRLDALQRFRESDVVFARVGDVYEVRMLELGRRDAERVEVLDGLRPGEDYVTTNSYLIKADIEKSGASHDH